MLEEHKSMKLDNFHERMQRVLLLAPLYQLGRQAKLQAKDGTELSCLELGLMTLLFFFEHMLDGKKQAGIRSLAAFLEEQTKDELAMTGIQYEKLARDIVAVFRPPTGRRNTETFFNWETKSPDQVEYSYLRAAKADIAANEQYYVLDEQGLELIFATKEYFNEFQLSINQLILRKQLEKGQFVLALRQIEEMRLDVETIRGRISRIGREIHRNIVSEETLARYRKIIADINLRLKGEEEEFLELKTFVQETKSRIRGNTDTDLERRAYANILEVEQRLDDVHGGHRGLLKLGISLGTTALQAAEEALYFAGIDSFNFEQEITSRMFASPLPITASRRLVEPFLSLEAHRSWSPLAVFLPQRLERLEREGIQECFPEITEDAIGSGTLENLQRNYAHIVACLLQFLGDRNTGQLNELLGSLSGKEAFLCQNRQFYVFWLLLHRQGILQLREESVTEKSVYWGIFKSLPQLQSIQVFELPEIIEVGEFSISNMKIVVVKD